MSVMAASCCFKAAMGYSHSLVFKAFYNTIYEEIFKFRRKMDFLAINTG